MREIVQKRIKLVTNVAIIVVTVLLVAVLVHRFVLDDSEPQAKPPSVKLGAKIELPGVDWSKSSKHLVLVLRKDCHFCSESAPFYRRLVREAAGRTDLQLIAVLPQSGDEAKQYLSDMGISINSVSQATVSSLGLVGTPTLLLVNASGAITEAWVGKLPPSKEDEVLRHLEME